MKKEVLKKFTLGGILWTLVIGTLSHFFYQWSGENFLIGLLSPVNETVWEHLKLLFFSCSAVYAGREGLAGGKIPWKILRKSPGTVGRPGCNAGTVLWLYLVYRKGLSLGRYRDFCHKRADGFSGALFLQEPPCGILQSEKKPAGTFCPADSVLSGVSCFYEMNRSCSRGCLL